MRCQVSGVRCQVSKKAGRIGSYKAGKLEGQEAEKLNYLQDFQPYSLQASQLPSFEPRAI
jgi:hypothetical protein